NRQDAGTVCICRHALLGIEPDLQQPRAHLKAWRLAGDRAHMRGKRAGDRRDVGRSGRASFLNDVNLQSHSVASRPVAYRKERLRLDRKISFRVHTSIHSEHTTPGYDIEVGPGLDAAADEHQRSPGCVRRYAELRAATADSSRQALQSSDNPDRVFECVSSL